jgi:hypothetical protein
MFKYITIYLILLCPGILSAQLGSCCVNIPYNGMIYDASVQNVSFGVRVQEQNSHWINHSIIPSTNLLPVQQRWQIVEINTSVPLRNKWFIAASVPSVQFYQQLGTISQNNQFLGNSNLNIGKFIPINIQRKPDNYSAFTVSLGFSWPLDVREKVLPVGIVGIGKKAINAQIGFQTNGKQIAQSIQFNLWQNKGIPNSGFYSLQSNQGWILNHCNHKDFIYWNNNVSHTESPQWFLTQWFSGIGWSRSYSLLSFGIQINHSWIQNDHNQGNPTRFQIQINKKIKN